MDHDSHIKNPMQVGSSLGFKVQGIKMSQASNSWGTQNFTKTLWDHEPFSNTLALEY